MSNTDAIPSRSDSGETRVHAPSEMGLPAKSTVERVFYNQRMARPREFDIDAVLDGPWIFFWAQGYETTGMQGVCRATGLNAGSLYLAFGDKRGLFIQALQRYMRVVSHQAIERLNSNPWG